MSPEQNNIQALESAIMEEAAKEARKILAEAQAQADSIRGQAQAQSEAKRETILQQAREEAKATGEHTVATAQLEAQRLKLRRREEALTRVFADAHQQLASVAQWPDYEQIAHRLVHEAVEHMGTDEALVRADEKTRRILSGEVLADLGQELGVRLHTGELLAQSIGVVLETPDHHRRYDNTLETRLGRMKDSLRTPVYHILMGETV